MEFDKDLTARQEARTLCKAAAQAQHILADMSQEQLDAIVEAIAKAFAKEASVLADMAVRETGFGNVRVGTGGGSCPGYEDRGTAAGGPGEKALGDRRPRGRDRGHRTQHQSHVYRVL